jgi:hypothetical protein
MASFELEEGTFEKAIHELDLPSNYLGPQKRKLRSQDAVRSQGEAGREERRRM